MKKKLNLLQLEHIQKYYLSDDGKKKNIVLKDISFSVKSGDTIAITGPSGSGKSTLLNIIGTLDRASTGKIIFNGKDISKTDSDKLSLMRNDDIGFIFQLHHLLPQCTVLENVLVPLLAFSKSITKEQHNRAVKLLTRVGLKNQINNKPGQLSGGEQLRTAVVRALINEPQILLADEPTGSLDSETAEKIIKLIIELNNENNLTLIVVTHSEHLAKKMKTRYKLHKGKLSKA